MYTFAHIIQIPNIINNRKERKRESEKEIIVCNHKWFVIAVKD